MRDYEEAPRSAKAGGGAPAFDTMVILLCAAVFFLDGLIHSILGPLAPEIAQELQLSHAEMGPIFSANLIGQFFGLMLVPMLADRLGHRNITILTLVGFGLFEAMVGLAADETQLFTLRMITGFFLGGCMPSCMAIVMASAPAERRGLAITMLFTGYGLGATLAGLTASLFLDLGGWRAASVSVGTLCVVFAAFAWLRLPEPKSDGEDDAAAEMPAGLWHELGALFSRKLIVGTLMLWLLFIAMLTVSYCLISWLPTMLVEVGRSATIASTSISIFSFGGIVAALGVGLLIDRFGAIKVLVAFLLVATMMLFLTGQVLDSASDTMLLALLGAGGFFFLGAYGGVNVVLASFYPYRIRALGIGWAKSIGRIGTIIAPVIIGFGLDAGFPETWIMSLFAVPTAIASLALLVIALARSRPARMPNAAVPRTP